MLLIACSTVRRDSVVEKSANCTFKKTAACAEGQSVVQSRRRHEHGSVGDRFPSPSEYPKRPALGHAVCMHNSVLVPDDSLTAHILLHIYRRTPWFVLVVPLLALAEGFRSAPRLPHSSSVPLMRYSPLWMVARPRAAPIPRPRIALGPTRLNMGALANRSGTIMNRIWRGVSRPQSRPLNFVVETIPYIAAA